MPMDFPELCFWLDELSEGTGMRKIMDGLFKYNAHAIRLSLGNGSAFDLYISYHHFETATHRLVISPDGFPAAILDVDRGPFCMPKRFRGMPTADAVGMAYFATMLRFHYTISMDTADCTWEAYIGGDEFQDALRDMLPPWTQYERRPPGVPEWVAEQRPQTEEA